jgi:transmembrane sensor
MSKLRLTYLLGIYFNKTATSAERDELMDLLMDSENDSEVKMLLTETWQQFKGDSPLFNDKQGDDMLAGIIQRGRETVCVIPEPSPSFRWGRLAAAVIFFISATGIFFGLRQAQTKPEIVQVKKNPFSKKDVIVAGGNKAVLTLADGSNIILDSTHKGTLVKQGNTKVVQVNMATLAYHPETESSQQVVYNTLATPLGGQYQLILPDGSKVWLNAASSIHFPTVFKGNERHVTVTGEAYFEVEKNAAMPFTISVKDMEVKVLGTHFNIMAYDDESCMNTTLLEGSVKVSKGNLVNMLVPGQQSSIDKTGTIKVRDADVEEVMAWKNGWFQFNAHDIKTVMRQISRWYNVEVVYEGKIPAGHFTGLVSRNNNISQVLKIMQSAGVRFKIDGRKLIVLD